MSCSSPKDPHPFARGGEGERKAPRKSLGTYNLRPRKRREGSDAALFEHHPGRENQERGQSERIFDLDLYGRNLAEKGWTLNPNHREPGFSNTSPDRWRNGKGSFEIGREKEGGEADLLTEV